MLTLASAKCKCINAKGQDNQMMGFCFFASQMLVVWQTRPTSSPCRRRPKWPWRSTSGCSTPTSLSASAACCCASPLCAPCPQTSSPSSSSWGWWARRPSRRWSETCSFQGAPSAGLTPRDSELTPVLLGFRGRRTEIRLRGTGAHRDIWAHVTN